MSSVLDLIATAEHNPPAPPLRAGPMAPEVEGYQDDTDPSVGGGWQIETLGSADWALSRLGEVEAEVAEIDRQEAATVEGRDRTGRLRHLELLGRA